MSEEKAAAPAAESAPAAGGGAPSKLPLILSIVNTVATLAMVAVLVLSFKKEKTKPTVDDIVLKEHGEGEKAAGGHGEKGDAKGGAHGTGVKKKNEFGKMIPLDQFTVNLATPGTVNPKFLRLAITLEVPNDETENEVTAKMPQVRNAIIDLINSKRPADLASSEGREYLKEEIKNALNAFMVTGKVRGVYFTNFAVTG